MIDQHHIVASEAGEGMNESRRIFNIEIMEQNGWKIENPSPICRLRKLLQLLHLVVWIMCYKWQICTNNYT